MKRFTSAMVVTMLLISSAQADVIKPIDVRATSEFGLGNNTANLVNGDQGADIGLSTTFGLIPAGDPNSVLDDEHEEWGADFTPGFIPNATGWTSGCVSAGIAGGSPEEERAADCNDDDLFADPGIFSTQPVSDQIIEFEFDGAYDLTAAHIWNHNGITGAGEAQGLKAFGMQYSTDRTGDTFIDVADPNDLAFDDGFSNNSAQVRPLVASGVRRVRFLLDSSHFGDPNALDVVVGLSEVRFEGTLVTLDLAADGTGPNLDDPDPNNIFNLHRGEKDGEVSGLDFLLWQAFFGLGEYDGDPNNPEAPPGYEQQCCLDPNGDFTSDPNGDPFFLNSTLTATQSTADYDNNNVVNHLDLAVWEAEYGMSSPLSASSASSASVPEPFSLMLVATAALGGLLTRRRRIRNDCTGSQQSTFLAEAGDRSYRQRE